MRPKIMFAFSTLFFSALLYAPLWMLSSGNWTSIPWNAGFVAPAVGIMLAAQGVPWGRRLAWAVGTASLFVLLDAMAILGGLQRASDLGNTVFAPAPYLVAHLVYHVFSLAYPVVALLLFVRKRPSDLWDAVPRPTLR